MSYSTKIKLPRSHPLDEAAQKFPNNTALISGERTYSYYQLYSKSLAIGKVLQNEGLLPGDIVILGECSVLETILSFWACTLMGYRSFPVNMRFPEKSLKALLSSIQPALCISEKEIIPIKTRCFSEFPEVSGEANVPNEFNLDTAASLLMTSGSGGTPKIVEHSYRNHIVSALGSHANIPLAPENRWLLNLPLYHVGGLSILFRTCLTGAAVVIPDTDDSLWDIINNQDVTHISMVGTQLHRSLDNAHGRDSLRTLTAVLLGGSAIPTALIQQALEMNIPIHVSYGSTEMASQITTTPGKDPSAGLHNSGRLLPGRDLIISHEGEILVKGETLALGYLEGTTLTPLGDDAGWFHTGDVGYVNVQGELTVTGRMDNQFISGGENIQPEHIELALTRIAGIANAIVLPQEDEEYGYRPIAYIVRSDSALTREHIVAQLRLSLPGYMIPIDFFEYPLEPTQRELKISRRELSEKLIHKNKHLHTLK